MVESLPVLNDSCGNDQDMVAIMNGFNNGDISSDNYMTTGRCLDL